MNCLLWCYRAASHRCATRDSGLKSTSQFAGRSCRSHVASSPGRTWLGTIEVGKLGDLVLLSDDLLTCDPERIKDIQPLLTVLGGKVVHDASSR